jgi:preprotein translocase subunit SecD
MSASGVLRLVFLALLGAMACLTTAVRGLSLGLDFEGGARLDYEVDAPIGADAPSLAARAQAVIAARVEALGISGASVRPREGTISVELPAGEPEQLEALRFVLGRMALLELLAVDDEYPLPSDLPPGLEVEEEPLMRGTAHHFVVRGPGARERLRDGLASLAPAAGRRFALGATEDGGWRSYALASAGGVIGHISDAEVLMDEQTNTPVVAVEYDPDGRVQLAELTRRQVGRRIAIVLDGEVRSAPVVQEPITGGSARITLGADARDPEALLVDAQSLVLALRAGALPAPVVLTSESLIGPSVSASTRALWALGAAALILALTLLATLRYRAAGALWALLGATFAVALTLALTAAFDATISATSCAGLAAGVTWLLAAGLACLEVARRGGPAWLGWVLLGAAHSVALLVGVVLYGMSSGPLRGLATGWLAAAPAGAVVGALLATTLAGWVRSRATAVPRGER